MDIIKNIKKYAELFPNRIAYKINNEILTYEELEEKSNKLANQIQTYAKNDRTPVIVYGHKSKYMLISFLACVKSGRAYCPIDISVPEERVKQIIKTVNPKIILSTEQLMIENYEIWDKDKIIKECESKNSIENKYCVNENDVFYIIFTSGSTGNPKGVQITTECLNNFLVWSTTLDGIDKKENLNFLNQAPFSFDLSVMDLYTSLATGGTLIAIDKETQSDLKKMFNIFKESDLNVWVSTPSFISMCLADKLFCSELLPRMQTFLFCGEILPNTTAKKIMDRFKTSNIINTYGPTESTVAVTSVQITEDMIEKSTSLPVGKPKKDTYILIQNENHENLDENEKGEIVIVGNTVSIGYFNNEEKTRQVFENYRMDEKLYRSYRTGDMGYIKNGQLYYCGRIDFQVKLHGYRIEIEDIENNILKHTSVKMVAVVPKYDEDGITVKYLQAYIVPNNTIENNLQEVTKIKEELRKYLPNYMIPKKIKFIENIPTTNNCKIDRKALGKLEI